MSTRINPVSIFPLRSPFRSEPLKIFKFGQVQTPPAQNPPIVADAQSTAFVQLAWDPPAPNNVAGYVLYFGTQSAAYSGSVNVGNVTTATVPGLIPGTAYYFAVTAYNQRGESDPSEEVAYTPPLPKPHRPGRRPKPPNERPKPGKPDVIKPTAPPKKPQLVNNPEPPLVIYDARYQNVVDPRDGHAYIEYHFSFNGLRGHNYEVHQKANQEPWKKATSYFVRHPEPLDRMRVATPSFSAEKRINCTFRFRKDQVPTVIIFRVQDFKDRN